MPPADMHHVRATKATVSTELNTWLDRIRAADSITLVLAIVEEFRPLEWSDTERSQMSKVYIRKIDSLSGN